VFETNEKIKNKPSILRTDVPSSHHSVAPLPFNAMDNFQACPGQWISRWEV